LEMSRFLVERYPEGLHQENLRGETPLFPAVRSGNDQMVVDFIKAWPPGGKHVLQRVRKDDDVRKWPVHIMNLCLRGAVENFGGLSDNDDDQNALSRPLLHFHADMQHSANADGFQSPVARHQEEQQLQHLHINKTRSKSPTLEEARKKRPSNSSDDAPHKRSRQGHIEDHRRPPRPAYRTFYQVHAAIACGASPPVVECILNRYPDQIRKVDHLGRRPLHIALCSERSKSFTEIFVNAIWRPFQEACFHHDQFGYLPLHLALMHRADFGILHCLLETNPSSGVEPIVPGSDVLPLHMALRYECDVSTIFSLLRGDPSIVGVWQDGLEEHVG